MLSSCKVDDEEFYDVLSKEAGKDKEALNELLNAKIASTLDSKTGSCAYSKDNFEILSKPLLSRLFTATVDSKQERITLVPTKMGDSIIAMSYDSNNKRVAALYCCDFGTLMIDKSKQIQMYTNSDDVILMGRYCASDYSNPSAPFTVQSDCWQRLPLKEPEMGYEAYFELLVSPKRKAADPNDKRVVTTANFIGVPTRGKSGSGNLSDQRKAPAVVSVACSQRRRNIPWVPSKSRSLSRKNSISLLGKLGSLFGGRHINIHPRRDSKSTGPDPVKTWGLGTGTVPM